MIKMAEHLKGYWPNQLSFSESCGMVMRMLMTFDARSCKYGTTCEITDKKGKGLPESGKGEALEIPHSPEKEPVSCLTDWHYS